MAVVRYGYPITHEGNFTVNGVRVIGILDEFGQCDVRATNEAFTDFLH